MPCWWPCCNEGCPTCPVAPAQWQMTVSGITNGVCLNCTRWNGSWILTNHPLIPLSGGPCYWSSPVELGFAPCISGCANCSRWTLVLTATTAELLVDGLGMGSYVLPIASFNCMGTNVLTLAAADTDCNNWPATITLSPV